VIPLEFHRRGRPGVYHVRMGGCAGCAEVVDSALRDTRGAARLGEMSSPRHADAVLITGCWSEDLDAAVSLVTSQAPSPRVVVAVGDCAMGEGLVAKRLALRSAALSHLRLDLEIPGCPVEKGRLLKEVRDVAG
jgi:formate hydrogenlyase subunit 7